MSMFKITAYQHINAGVGSCSSKDIYLIKNVELPFPPYPDLEIKTGDWSLFIQDIHWDIVKRIITVPNKG